MKVLANDGISQSGVKKLKEAGFEVIEKKVAQNQLNKYLNDNNITAILVRSATQVRKDLIDACPKLKLIGRGGVGLDNIDVDYAKSKGVAVINTPAASSRSVAELVLGHLLSGIRHLHQSNREMPLEGESNFKQLKKKYKGGELKGKTLGIFGFGRIGRQVAELALGVGLNVIFNDFNIEDGQEETVELSFTDNQKVQIKVKSVSKTELLETADFITFHVPASKNYLISDKEIELMKNTAGIINTSRGGIINESAVDNALNEGQLGFAALDVFENEPHPPVKLLMNPNISFSPHIGGSTREAQERIGEELADQIIEKLGAQN